MVYAVLRQAAHPQAAMRLLERLTSPEACAEMAQLQAMLEATLTERLDPAAAVAHAADMIGAVTGFPVAHAG